MAMFAEELMANLEHNEEEMNEGDSDEGSCPVLSPMRDGSSSTPPPSLVAVLEDSTKESPVWMEGDQKAIPSIEKQEKINDGYQWEDEESGSSSSNAPILCTAMITTATAKRPLLEDISDPLHRISSHLSGPLPMLEDVYHVLPDTDATGIAEDAYAVFKDSLFPQGNAPPGFITLDQYVLMHRFILKMKTDLIVSRMKAHACSSLSPVPLLSTVNIVTPEIKERWSAFLYLIRTRLGHPVADISPRTEGTPFWALQVLNLTRVVPADRAVDAVLIQSSFSEWTPADAALAALFLRLLAQDPIIVPNDYFSSHVIYNLPCLRFTWISNA